MFQHCLFLYVFFLSICMYLSNYSLHQAFPHSSSSAEKSKLSLPIWASWDWGKTYLPHDIHTNQGKFDKALDLLYKYKFGDHDEGTSVVLGFSLLLRECWRAVEVEGDDEDSPRFLRESLHTCNSYTSLIPHFILPRHSLAILYLLETLPYFSVHFSL